MYTGYHTNPVSASHATLLCEGTTLEDHLLIYWVGPMVAAIGMALKQPQLSARLKLREETVAPGKKTGRKTSGQEVHRDESCLSRIRCRLC